MATRPTPRLNRRVRTGIRGWTTVVAAVTLAAGIVTVTIHQPRQPGRPAAACHGPWVNPHQSPDTRAAELLSAMTTAQKLAMVHQGSGRVDYGGAGVVPAIPSLCIPELTLNDAGSGLGDGQVGVTAYPAEIAQAAAWDPSMERTLGTSLGGEALAKGVNVLLGPDVNITRVPLGGRTSEQYGEDPYLSGQTAAAFIEGVQSQHVIATVKHDDANNQETNRATIDEKISDRVLHEIYQPPFDAAVSQGGAGAVMCAYNQVNGAYACQNPTLLRTDLDGQDHFPGFVVSDWGATHSAAPSAEAGLDLEMHVFDSPGSLPLAPAKPSDPDWFGAPLAAAVKSGAVPMTVLDGMVTRIVRSMFAEGLFDHPAAAEPGAYLADVDTFANRRIAAEAAEEGTVLLKDAGGVLPLGPAAHEIALIGADADPAGAPTVAQAGGSVHVDQPDIITPLQAIAARAAHDGDTVFYADGTSVAAAVAAARRASVAIVYAGYSEAEGSDLTGLGFNQATTCSLSCTMGPDPGTDALIAAVAAANPRTVVVLNTGGPVLMPWLGSVAGVVEAWYPGEEDGLAAAAVLFGDVDPGGKLPVTFPASLSELPTRTAAQFPGVDGKETYSEGLDVGYRWYDAKDLTPLFPFGFGLSYTTFTVKGLSAHPNADGSVTVQVVLTDTGARSGSDVVQLYVADPATTGEPPIQLKAYQRVSLDPGRSATVTLAVPSEAFAVWSGRWSVSAGCDGIDVGDSSADLPVRFRVAEGGGSCA
jgi:beta-glucosidase